VSHAWSVSVDRVVDQLERLSHWLVDAGHAYLDPLVTPTGGVVALALAVVILLIAWFTGKG
jgi:hypothetical protein